MRERLMVRGSKFWVADKDANVLISYHDTKAEAKAALKALEAEDRVNGYYIPYFYKIVEGVLGALRLRGYVALDDVRTSAEV